MHFGFAETNSLSERIESFIFRLSSVTKWRTYWQYSNGFEKKEAKEKENLFKAPDKMILWKHCKITIVYHRVIRLCDMFS